VTRIEGLVAAAAPAGDATTIAALRTARRRATGRTPRL